MNEELLDDGELDVDPVTGDDIPDPEEARKANRSLQQHVKKLEAENATYRAQLVGVHLDALGLDPEKGLGKAILKEYKGEISVEAVAAFAKDEYGHESATPPEAPAEVTQGQNIDALQQQGQSLLPQPTLTPEQIAEQRMHDPHATREDAAAAVASKVAAFTQEHYGPKT